MDERFARLQPLVGREGIERLDTARVAVFGLGGVGGSCVEALVRGGIGALVLIDGDAVEPSNINRQAIAFESTLGMRKVDAAARLVHDINPTCSLELHDRFVTREDACALLDGILATGPLDFIVDCIDTLHTKLALAQWAEQTGTPFVSCAGTARKFDASAFEFADLYDTTVCPLCRAMRHEARKMGIKHIRMLYSREIPHTAHVAAYVAAHVTASAEGTRTVADTENAESAEGAGNAEGVGRAEQVPTQTPANTLGTMSYVPPIAGMLLAGHVLRTIASVD